MRGKLLVFYLNGMAFGIDITAVKEVNRNIGCTPVPGAPAYVVGLLNMRGVIVTLLNLKEMMGLEEDDANRPSACLVLKTRSEDGDHAGFLIDRPGDVVDVEEDWWEPPPASVKGISGEFVDGLVKSPDELVLAVKPSRIINK